MSQDEQQLHDIPSAEIQPEDEHRYEEKEQYHMVPVTESIKYRKRAQAAEQQVEKLTRQLEESQQKQKKTECQFEEKKRENDVIQHLMKAGAVDMEAAMVLTKHKLDAVDDKGVNLNNVIGLLQKERPYLFSQVVDEVSSSLSIPTAGIRTQKNTGTKNLSRLARQAQSSGSRKDIQEYLRLRRSVMGLG